MAEKDSQSNSQEQHPEPKFSQEQYEMLKRCSEKKDITEWNKWRKEHKDEEIRLENANLRRAHLKNVNLSKAHLENADLRRSHLENADMRRAHLENAILRGAHPENANLSGAHLEDADLLEANLQGAIFRGANIKSTDFSRTIVDGKTLVWNCEVDRNTKFEGVGLDSMRIYPATKQLLEYNIRRMNWELWYEYKDWDKIKPEDKRKRISRILRQPIQSFWAISNYGLSTWRIVFTFFGLALVFANIYYHWARLAPPGIVENLSVDRNGVDVQSWLVPLRTLYFSIVTQTTLGFGDMYARAQSICGHILLSLQVILGYVLLGALVTRFAVLFTAGGPAGEFTEKNKRANKDNK